jgi:hypothetical protein
VAHSTSGPLHGASSIQPPLVNRRSRLVSRPPLRPAACPLCMRCSNSVHRGRNALRCEVTHCLSPKLPAFRKFAAAWGCVTTPPCSVYL